MIPCHPGQSEGKCLDLTRVGACFSAALWSSDWRDRFPACASIPRVPLKDRPPLDPWISDMDKPPRKAVPKLRTIPRRNKFVSTVAGGESLDDACYLLEKSRAAACKVHFKQRGTSLAIQLGIYSSEGEHRSKGGSPDQWPAESKIRACPDFSWSQIQGDASFCPSFSGKNWMHFEPHVADFLRIGAEQCLGSFCIVGRGSPDGERTFFRTDRCRLISK